MKSTWQNSKQCLFKPNPGYVQMLWSHKESRTLNWNWTSHPNSRGFLSVGVSGVCFISFSGERERGRQCSPFSWNILTEDPILSPPAGPCCCSAHCWGLNQNTSTPDGWGRTHPGFIKKKLPHLFKVLTSWSCMFLFSENAASPSCLSQFTRLLWNTLKVEPQD